MSAVSISLMFFDLMYNLVGAYFYCKIGQIKLELSSRNKIVLNILILITSTVFTSFLVLKVSPDIRVLLKLLMILLTYSVMFRQSKTRNLMITVLIYLSCVVSEMIVVFGAELFVNISPNEWLMNVQNVLISNFIILCVSTTILAIPKIQRLAIRIVHWYSNKDFLTLVIITTIGMFCSVFLLIENFKGVDSLFLFSANNIFSFGIILLVIILIIEKANNNRILEAYDKLIDYVKVYEKVITERGKQQHEYKNQLIFIREMLNKNDKKTIKYINEQLKLETEDKKMQLFGQLKNVPEGGLKGLIYYKIQEMKKNQVDVFISVDGALENEKLWIVCDENLRDISRIVGVYLDNAAESAKNAQQKSFAIDIGYDDGNLVFSFSNTYSGSLDVSSMGKEGYTTKGLNRGFGLSLVRDILSKNNYLSQEKEVNGRFYVQRLIVHSENKNEY